MPDGSVDVRVADPRRNRRPLRSHELVDFCERHSKAPTKGVNLVVLPQYLRHREDAPAARMVADVALRGAGVHATARLIVGSWEGLQFVRNCAEDRLLLRGIKHLCHVS
eukprot:scaffold1187_cov258-Pinguiococcus_pyrenoidosus.AAC.5